MVGSSISHMNDRPFIAAETTQSADIELPPSASTLQSPTVGYQTASLVSLILNRRAGEVSGADGQAFHPRMVPSHA
jgi:hypothetical protein